MRREKIAPRPAWQKIVASQGLTYHTLEDGNPYWDESWCYRFSSDEVERIEKATNDLQEMCLKAGQFIIDHGRWKDLGIPQDAWAAIQRAWNEEPPSIYGRMDLAYDGKNPPKLLEYNANTPTGLIEAAVTQWYWLEDVKRNRDQFNSIHEKLIAQWKNIAGYWKDRRADATLYMSGVDVPEDVMTLAYMEDVARQAGIDTKRIEIRDIGWNEKAAELRDLKERRIGNLFALYPWEWLLSEHATAAIAAQRTCNWIEPIWKMLWSNKGLLAILWEMYPGHENLLEARLDGPGRMTEFVKKPLLSREGANIQLKTSAGTWKTSGEYGAEGYVYQAAAPLFSDDGKFATIGSWIVMDHGACGIGVRESDSPITGNVSRFVPHYF